MLARAEVVLERVDGGLQHAGGLGEPRPDPGLAVLVGGLDLDDVGALRARLLDQAADGLLAGSSLDVRLVRHQP